MSSMSVDNQDSMKRATSAFINSLKIPQLTSVRFEGAPSSTGLGENEGCQMLKGVLSLKSIWSQSSVASGSKINFSRTDVCSLEKCSSKMEHGENFRYKSISGITMPTPNDTNSFISDYCSKNELEVLIRKRTKGENKDEPQFILEIWKPNQLLRSINLTEIDAHGEVYLDGELGGLAINRQGTKLAYIAEEKRPKSTPFFKGYGASVVNPKKGIIINI